MAVRVGINGFGRIGRNFVRAALANPSAGVEIAAINDPFGESETLAHLLKYDSVAGVLPADVSATDDALTVGGTRIVKLSERDPAQIPWGDNGCDIVVESSGVFTARDKAAGHLDGGAKKVVISAPSGDADVMVCVGINDDAYDAGSHSVISNASCTTNCLAPMATVLNDSFTIEKGLITTVHAYTSDQALQDIAQATRSGKPDLRRMRAAALSIIPNSTGAAKAIGKVIPALNGKLDGMALRVPVPDGSITDLVVQVPNEVTVEQVNAAFKAAAEGPLKGVLEYTEAPLVSQDIVGNPHSCIFSARDTMVTGNLVKILGWYDNEWGYSNRLVDLCRIVAERGL